MQLALVKLLPAMSADKKPSAYRNAEGYYDPTAGEAYSNITAEERKRDAERLAAISALMPVLRMTAGLVGCEIVGRITFADKDTGKKYK